jgi:uncharacterized protein (DUF4415 family)
MRARGESQTDWARVDAMTEEELERAIAADPDADLGPVDWSRVQVGFPRPKKAIHIRLDADVVDWFKAQGPGYQTRINAILRSYVASRSGA